jgi:hypothetical protein
MDKGEERALMQAVSEVWIQQQIFRFELRVVFVNGIAMFSVRQELNTNFSWSSILLMYISSRVLRIFFRYPRDAKHKIVLQYKVWGNHL